MILQEPLKNLEVVLKNGGSIITHRALFTPDSQHLLIVSGNKILKYNIKTSACTCKIEPPSGDDICNIAIDPSEEETLVVCTVQGFLYYYQISNGALRTNARIDGPANWAQKLLSVENFIYPGRENFFIVASIEGFSLPNLYAVFRKDEIKFFLEKVCVNISEGMHSVAVGANGQFLAAIQDNHDNSACALFVRDCSSGDVKKHFYGERKLVSVAVHPYDWVCATGDDTGRVVLWVNSIRQNVPARTVFHWHTLPVGDLAFSIDGTQIHSGGGECTLVKWDISNTENKRTVPRLGLPIRHVSVSSKDSLTVISQADNSLKVINAHNKVIGTIQNITQCYIPEGEKDDLASSSTFGGSEVYQAGLIEDPNQNALLMNGKPGQLQCYSFAQDKHLYDLDIVQQNYITAERNKPIPFSNVTHTAFSNRGKWLATIESRRQEGSFTEIRLKFWKYEASKQKFSLNTSIEWPHENGVISLKIQPIGEDDATVLAATSGGDRRFKTWGIVQDTSIHSKSEWWNCENVGTHRNLPAGPLSFSKDGSLLAASFSRSITLWTTAKHEFKGALAHQRLTEALKFMEFGNGTCSHLIICSSQSYLAVWDVISFSLLWAIPLQVDSLALDPFSENIVAFSSKNHAYFFRADESEPLAVHNHVTKSKVLASTFISSKCTRRSGASTLVFINASQELCSFLPKAYNETQKEPASIKYSDKDAVPLTPFAQMIANKTVSQVPESTNILKVGPKTVGLIGAQVIQAIIESSPHTMPSISFYCEQLLNATTVKVNPGERFQEMESLVLQSHVNKNVKRLKLVEEEEMEVEGSPDTSQNNQIQQEEPSDLNLVAEENVTWIHDIVFS